MRRIKSTRRGVKDMPIYEYECGSCGHRHEAIQKMSDAPLTDCPQCAEPALRKLVSAAGFRLSGGGWYETDFKKDKKRNIKDGGASEGGSATKDSGGGCGAGACGCATTH
jgi:putative FmdB family regulatory protein